MSRDLFISQLTALPLAPPRLLELAAAVGVGGVGIRMLPAAPGGTAYSLMDDPVLLRETLAVKAATGVRIVDLELIRLAADFDVNDYKAFFDAGAALGAAHVLVAGDDPDEARTIASFGKLCEALRPYGLTADVEFMPWTHVRDLRAAKRIVGAAAQSNGGILVDALHFARSGSRLEDLDDTPRAWLHYVQICDGPARAPDTVEGLIHAARCERALPGEGGIDLVGLFHRLPADLPVGIETPSDSRAPKLGWNEWVRQAVAASREVLGRVAA